MQKKVLVQAAALVLTGLIASVAVAADNKTDQQIQPVEGREIGRASCRERV